MQGLGAENHSVYSYDVVLLSQPLCQCQLIPARLYAEIFLTRSWTSYVYKTVLLSFRYITYIQTYTTPDYLTIITVIIAVVFP